METGYFPPVCVLMAPLPASSLPVEMATDPPVAMEQLLYVRMVHLSPTPSLPVLMVFLNVKMAVLWSVVMEHFYHLESATLLVKSMGFQNCDF